MGVELLYPYETLFLSFAVLFTEAGTAPALTLRKDLNYLQNLGFIFGPARPKMDQPLSAVGSQGSSGGGRHT